MKSWIAHCKAGWVNCRSPTVNEVNSCKHSAVLSFCRTIIFMVIPVLVLPRFFGMDGVWLSITVGEVLSLAMSIYYFAKFQNVWKMPAKEKKI